MLVKRLKVVSDAIWLRLWIREAVVLGWVIGYVGRMLCW